MVHEMPQNAEGERGAERDTCMESDTKGERRKIGSVGLCVCTRHVCKAQLVGFWAASKACQVT